MRRSSFAAAIRSSGRWPKKPRRRPRHPGRQQLAFCQCLRLRDRKPCQIASMRHAQRQHDAPRGWAAALPCLRLLWSPCSLPGRRACVAAARLELARLKLASSPSKQIGDVAIGTPPLGLFSGEEWAACVDFERSECYHPPLELEDGAQGTFLETTFEWKGDARACGRRLSVVPTSAAGSAEGACFHDLSMFSFSCHGNLGVKYDHWTNPLEFPGRCHGTRGAILLLLFWIANASEAFRNLFAVLLAATGRHCPGFFPGQ